jgi:hypothetical protein
VASKPSKGKTVDFETVVGGMHERGSLEAKPLEQPVNGPQPQGARMLGKARSVKMQQCQPWFGAILWENLWDFPKGVQAMVNMNASLLERRVTTFTIFSIWTKVYVNCNFT